MSLVEEYFAVHEKYVKDTHVDASNLDVLMQVGSFYEVYSTASHGGNAAAVARLLNLQLTRKDKKAGTREPPDARNPAMTGFPCAALAKYKPLLIDAGRTVVVVNQSPVPDAVSGRMQRVVEGVYNRSTYLEGACDRHVSCFVVVDTYGYRASAGMCCVDLAGGTIRLCEFHDDSVAVFDAVASALQRSNPSDVKFFVAGTAPDSPKQLATAFRVRDGATTTADKYRTLAPDVVDSVLADTWPRTRDGMLTPSEILGLERHAYACGALVHALETLQLYHPSNVVNLEHPTFDTTGSLVLERDVLLQLSVLPGSDTKCLYHILDGCSTPMGSDALRRALCYPKVASADVLAAQDVVQGLLDGRTYEDVAESLKGVGNVPLAMRRLGVGTIRDADVQLLAKWLRAMLRAQSVAGDRPWVADVTKFADRIEACVVTREDLPVQYVGIDAELDAAWETLDAALERLSVIATRLRTRNGLPQGAVRVACGSDGYVVSSSRRSALVGATVAPCKTGVNLHGADIDAECARANSARETVEGIGKSLFRQWCRCEFATYGGAVKDACRDVGELDMAASHARSVKALRLTRPVVVEDSTSHLKCIGLRHPIVEAVSDVPYTPTDVTIGHSCDGMLLHGINSSGKSTLIKAVGLAVIMAQAGLWVACERMEISPFLVVSSQVDFHDDICRGNSSFVVECQGLNAMLRVASPRALLLADELTRGTEARSSVAIFSAAVKSFQAAGARFVMSSHLTELDAGLAACGVDMSRVRTCHFSHTILEDGSILFDRSLRDGRGPVEYGVTVLEHVLKRPDFVRLARGVLAGMRSPRKSGARKSRYNPRKTLVRCEICKGACTETHHIEQQKHADAEGRLPDGTDVHALHNLVALCETCHVRVHKGELCIDGYVHTSKGRQLVVSKNAMG